MAGRDVCFDCDMEVRVITGTPHPTLSELIEGSGYVKPSEGEIKFKEGPSQFDIDVADVLTELSRMLIEKNKKYGDAALNPNQTFSRCDAVELINVRIDDKLSRIRNRKDNEDEDPEWDLLGYLVLKRIALKRQAKK
jgi:hypothetical protein